MSAEPETVEELAEDAVARLRALGRRRAPWGDSEHTITLSWQEVRLAHEVRCADCDAVLKSRYGPPERSPVCRRKP